MNTLKPLKPLMLLGTILLAGCASPRPDHAVAVQCPLPPVLPATVRQLPPEATADLEALLLEFASETR